MLGPMLRCLGGLEQAIEVLDAQFETCQQILVEVAKLQNKDLKPELKTPFPGCMIMNIPFPSHHCRYWLLLLRPRLLNKIEEQSQCTRVACHA